jgi:SpoVK/Ycf46/Vps4 family AAA+-type ATPase
MSNNIKQNTTLILKSSPEACKKLKQLFEDGQLSEIAGIPVEDVWLGEKITPKKRATKLTQWLKDTKEAVEDTVKNISGLFYSLQDLGLADATRKSKEYSTKAKIIDLDVQSVAFIVTVAPDNTDENKTKVDFWLEPLDDDPYLPVGLEFTVLDEDGEAIEKAIADNTKFTKLVLPSSETEKLAGEEGDHFMITISLGDVIITEHFEI